jgi:hypothetical protein
VNLVFLAPGIEIASIILVFRQRYLTAKRWISHGGAMPIPAKPSTT